MKRMKKRNWTGLVAVMMAFAVLGGVAGCGAAPRDTALSDSMTYANAMANGVQAYFTDSARTAFAVKNTGMSAVHELARDGEKLMSYLENSSGARYFENSLDVYLKDGAGNTYYASKSSGDGRMNTTRLGWYYYETHIRELYFQLEDSGEEVETSHELGVAGGWSANMMGDPEYTDGGMVLKVADPVDPYFHKSGFQLDPGICEKIAITVKVEGAPGTARLYFFTENTGGFNEEQAFNFDYTADGEFHTYVLDLEATGKLDSPLYGVRFDMGAAAGDVFTVSSVKALGRAEDSMAFRLDKTFHVYSDKLHQEYRIVSETNGPAPVEFGMELRLESAKVAAVSFSQGGEVFDDITKIEPDKVEYAAFDIEGAGVIGIIVPLGDGTAAVNISRDGDYYVLTQTGALPETLTRGQSSTFGSRLYTDETHSFEGVKSAAEEERNPLSGITVDGADGAEFLGYDSLRGAYQFTMNGSHFNKAYYEEPQKHYAAEISVEGGERDRNIYLWMHTPHGCLEAAAILDDKGVSVPIPLEVCKNFQGEFEEKFYDPEDLAYGDTFVPIKAGAGKKLDFTLLNLYQNWGNFPLKQISSIQFHISYYHLSTGVTESNCIAPYFVYGKDHWTLPDFRGGSGIMWDSQPQFNSVGRLYFVSYMGEAGFTGSEYTGAKISSSGLTYADIDYSYISDDGAYKYTLRHFEFPQTDENRTYYTISLEFLEDTVIADAREDFSLFSIDGRDILWHNISWLNAENEPEKKALANEFYSSEIISLGREFPYFAYYGYDPVPNAPVGQNFGLVVKNSHITVGGEEWAGNFAFRNLFNSQLNVGALTLDEGEMSFKKGDRMEVDLILLPYGSHENADDANILAVREDSAKNALTVTAQTGNVVSDSYLPVVQAKKNAAEFTISGGRGQNAVRVDGFTALARPKIYEKKDGQWVEYLFSVSEYDGYSVHFDPETGTYGYSFVYEMDGSGSPRTFKMEAGK